VEAARHDPVSGVEGLLHAIPVMDVDVDVEHARVVPEKIGEENQDKTDIMKKQQQQEARIIK